MKRDLRQIEVVRHPSIHLGQVRARWSGPVWSGHMLSWVYFLIINSANLFLPRLRTNERNCEPAADLCVKTPSAVDCEIWTRTLKDKTRREEEEEERWDNQDSRWSNYIINTWIGRSEWVIRGKERKGTVEQRDTKVTRSPKLKLQELERKRYDQKVSLVYFIVEATWTNPAIQLLT